MNKIIISGYQKVLR